MKAKGVQDPFWVTSTWPAHLMWWSLIYQFPCTPYNEDGSQAQFNSEAGVQALTWQVSNIQQGYSPKNVCAATPGDRLPAGQERPHLGRHLDDERVGQDQEPGLGCSAFHQIGSQPAVWASSHNFAVTSQAQKDPNKLQAAKAFIAYISDHSIDWAKSGQVPARASVREARSSRPSRSSRSPPRAGLRQVSPAVAGIGDVTTPTFELAVNEAVLGKKSPKAALDEATSKASQLLAANKKKYGGSGSWRPPMSAAGRAPAAGQAPARCGAAAGGSAPVGRRGAAAWSPTCSWPPT